MWALDSCVKHYLQNFLNDQRKVSFSSSVNGSSIPQTDSGELWHSDETWRTLLSTRLAGFPPSSAVFYERAFSETLKMVPRTALCGTGKGPLM